jgi:hypothetical protein
MNSSQKPANSPLEPVFVRDGGVPYRLSETADGIDAWINLMEAVEAMCPHWPDRAPTAGSDYRM